MSEVASVQHEAPPFPRMQGVGDDGFVYIDVACRKCGYDLRALSADARCPECGTEVLFSLRSEQLCDADPHWVLTLSRGAYWIAATLIVQFIATCILRPIIPPMEHHRRWIDIPFFVPWLAGVWMLSRPDPSGRGELAYGRLRRWWLGLAVASVALDCADLIASQFPPTLNSLVRIAQSMLHLVTAVVGLRYLVGLSRRMMDRSLEWRAHVLSISFAVCNAVFVCIAIGELLQLQIGFRSWSVAIMAIGLLVYALTALLYVGMLGRLGDRLRSQVLLADALVAK